MVAGRRRSACHSTFSAVVELAHIERAKAVLWPDDWRMVIPKSAVLPLQFPASKLLHRVSTFSSLGMAAVN